MTATTIFTKNDDDMAEYDRYEPDKAMSKAARILENGHDA